MTYDTSYLAADYLYYLKAVQKELRHERHALKVAHYLGIRIRIGWANRCTPDHPNGPLMVVTPWNYGNTDVVRHEEAHIILWWSGLEAEIIAEFGEELGWRVVENLCQFAVGFMRITQPMVDEAIRRYGVSAKAVRYLQKVSGADALTALNRLVYDDPRSCRAGFLLSGCYVAQTAECNWGLPFRWLDQVHNLRKRFPEDANVSWLKLTPSQTLGVCWG
ncbi:hypothetical protein [Deinococcus hopiensis]|uniref:Uncharacterized protein n=1 Tax=Deinococcus hopiensis KR-140 TaxID=695939 RepID=A0A1W1VJ89_9DEIO|nr:hypothetical protein [Deinococcus hopiensis]SMB93396.1 hypothetical protein SAMN00790413_01966 [Deinococcus hopiensis KR-140]